MRIVNIYTTKKEMLIEWFVRYLIEKNVSYVEIDGEIHFLNNIFRIYDAKDIGNLNDKAINFRYDTIDNSYLDILSLCSYDDLLTLNNSRTVLEDVGVVRKKEDIFKKNNTFYNKGNAKRLLRCNNHNINSQLRNNGK